MGRPTGSSHVASTMAVVVAAGGVMGYIRRRSLPSLAAGLGIGAVFGLGAHLTNVSWWRVGGAATRVCCLPMHSPPPDLCGRQAAAPTGGGLTWGFAFSRSPLLTSSPSLPADRAAGRGASPGARGLPGPGGSHDAAGHPQRQALSRRHPGHCWVGELCIRGQTDPGLAGLSPGLSRPWLG